MKTNINILLFICLFEIAHSFSTAIAESATFRFMNVGQEGGGDNLFQDIERDIRSPSALKNFAPQGFADHEILKEIPSVKSLAPLSESEPLETLSGKPTKILSQTKKEEFQEGAPATHAPMVKDLGGGQFQVDATFEEEIPTLINMNKLAYALGKDQKGVMEEYLAALTQDGWEVKSVSGRSGKDNRIEDNPGFVAYNKSKNIMTVVMRGSQTKADEEKSADWEVNFDGEMIDTSIGKVHRGFYNKSMAVAPRIVEAMEEFMKELTPDQKKNIRVIFTGHSQGAALASFLLPLTIDIFKTKKTFGPNFDNAQQNVFMGYLISAPRVYGDEKGQDWIHTLTGKDNIIRQNVTGNLINDPVPVGSPGRTLTNLLKLIPFAGESLAKKYGGGQGTRSVGYLAADLSKDVLTRRASVDFQALGERRLTAINKAIAEFQETGPSFKTAKSLFNAFIKEPLTDTLWTLVGPLHYGSTHNQVEEGAYFGPEVVAGYLPNTPRMATLLEQGYQKKQSEKAGLSGALRQGIEALGEAKTNVSNTIKNFAKTAISKLFWR